MACGPREEVQTRCNSTLHDPGYGTKRCLNVDWDRMANTLCFHRDRVFGHYEIRVVLARSAPSGSVRALVRYSCVQHLQEEMAAFPYGESDDMHDTTVWALLRIRRGGFRIPTDEEED
jgi:hypothetical protein